MPPLLRLTASAAIHDFEIALAGHTSEDVEAVLPDGRFGSAEETGREMNRAIAGGVSEGLGMGEALGRWLELCASPQYAASSLLLGAYRNAHPGDGARGHWHGYAAHPSGGRRRGHRRRYPSRFSPAVLLSSRSSMAAAFT